ncbi:MAG TPA: peptide ABC transporter substrate-binding protein [Chloroflexota bacterium]|nr:peptide ABC transporter substrate-binding protein [Chloroflexota bacterium]
MDTLKRRGILITGAAAALAACGPTGSTGTGGTSTGSSSSGGSTSQNAQPSQQAAVPLADKQLLVLNAGAEPDSIDPQKASFVGEIGVIMRVFSNLLTYNDKGELVPEMAEKMPTVSADGKTMTFTLKSGLKYSDGRALTAKDFEYAWKRHLDPRTKGEYAFTGYVIEGAEELNESKATDAATLSDLMDKVGVKATDEKTLQFKLKTAAPWFMSVLATWCGVPTRQDMIEKGGEKWTEPATYIGNGPYKLVTWQHQDRMAFEANPNYHKGAPPLKNVELAMINEPAVAFAAYKNGELDVVGVQAEDMPAVNGDAQLKQQYQRYPGSCSYYVGMNTKIAPFDKAPVRKAIGASFNRQSFVDNVLGGIGLPSEQFLPPKFPGYYDDLKGQKFDAAGAKKLLADGGFADPKSFPQVKFTYSSNARNKVRVEALVNMLQQNLGITVLADPVESRAFTALTKDQATTPPMYLLGWCQDYPDPQNWYSTVFHSRASVSHTGWKNAEFDKLVEQGDVEQDKAKRNDAYKKAAQILIDDAPVAFLYYGVVSRLVKPHVQGLPQNPLDYFEGQSNLFNVKIGKH